METGTTRAPFGYDIQIVDGKPTLEPNADADMVKLMYGLFNDLSEVYRKYDLEQAGSLALKHTAEALNTLNDGSAGRYHQTMK